MKLNRHWFRLLVGFYLPASTLISATLADAASVRQNRIFKLLDRRDSSASCIDNSDAGRLLADLKQMQGSISGFPAELSTFLQNMNAQIQSLESILKSSTATAAGNDYIASSSMAPPAASTPSGADVLASAPPFRGAAFSASTIVQVPTLSPSSSSASPPLTLLNGPLGSLPSGNGGLGNLVSLKTAASSMTLSPDGPAVTAPPATSSAVENALTSDGAAESSISETIWTTIQSTSTRFTTITETLRSTSSGFPLKFGPLTNQTQLASNLSMPVLLPATKLSPFFTAPVSGAVAATSRPKLPVTAVATRGSLLNTSSSSVASTSSSSSASLAQATSAAGAASGNSDLANPADSRNNMVVYYGQSSDTTADGLLELCQTPHIDVINLAFVTQVFGPEGWPTVDFGPACSGQTQSQARFTPGLQNCSQLGAQIAQCQSQYEKKIFVSVGGAASDTQSAISSSENAQLLAHTLWALFGGGSSALAMLPNNNDSSIRPFGPGVVLDGIDIDNEDHSTAYWGEFATELRALYRTDPSRTYYLSSTPQCPQPDASIPPELMALSDWVSVQFFNNPSCQLSNSSGFEASLLSWNQQLAGYSGNGTSTGQSPRLLIGMGAWSGAGSGYVTAQQLSSLLSSTSVRSASNLAGVMMWDGQEALANIDSEGSTYINSVGLVMARFAS